MAVPQTPPQPPFLSKGMSKSIPPRSFTGKRKMSSIAGPSLSKSDSKVEDKDINPPLRNELEPKQSVARKITARRSIRNISRSARRIWTTLRNASPEPANRVPPPSASFRQLREAALRERGLMPQKDMSALEREQDDRKSPTFPAPQTTLTDRMSEADGIKQQWEAKKTQSRSTLAEFPDANSQSAMMAIPSPKLMKMSSRSNLKAPKHPPTTDLPPAPMDPKIIPLPPSPFEKICNVRSFPISTQVIPIPPSPSSYSHTESTDPRASEPESNSSSRTPRPNWSLSAAPPPSSRVPSPSSPSACELWSDDGALVARPKSRSRSPSRAVLGSSDSEDDFGSIASPSLATSSQLTLESSLSYSTHSNHKARPNPLAKTCTNEPKVTVIVESPVEGHPMEQYGLILPSKSITEDEVMRESPADDSPSVPESDLNVGTRNTKTDGSPPSVPRQALGPTMHTPGSIWAETIGIEDDETRRLTEIAFLG